MIFLKKYNQSGSKGSRNRGNAIIAWILIAIIVLIPGCLENESSSSVPSMPRDVEFNKSAAELLVYPEEFAIYQDYITTIGGTNKLSDTGTIEATVISISRTKICPYQEEICSIDPYPNDFGVVRIDKILNYTSFSEQTAEQISDQSSSQISEENGNTISGYTGLESQSKPKPEFVQLEEGQEVQTHFLLTTRPVKIRYVPIGKSEDGMESLQQSEGNNTTISHISKSETKSFKSIPMDENYFVFTTKIGEFPRIIEKTLPGLEIGSKFRAEINYDGLLNMEEYELI